MSIRPAPLLVPLIALATWSSLGCEHDDEDTMLGPSRIGSSEAPFVSRLDIVEPPLVVGVAVPFASCPVTPPFLAPLNVVIHGSASSETTLSQVQMQLFDTRGTVAGFTTFSHTDLVGRFGSTVVPIRGTRTFPLSFPFGCVGGLAGTLNVVVFVVDSDGRERRTSHNVTIAAP